MFGQILGSLFFIGLLVLGALVSTWAEEVRRGKTAEEIFGDYAARR